MSERPRLESEANRELLYDFLELRSKAIAWYHEPAQAALDMRKPPWKESFALFHRGTALALHHFGRDL